MFPFVNKKTKRHVSARGSVFSAPMDTIQPVLQPSTHFQLFLALWGDRKGFAVALHLRKSPHLNNIKFNGFLPLG